MSTGHRFTPVWKKAKRFDKVPKIQACGQRIRYQKHCPVHGQVPTEAIVRGHQYAPGQYVVVEASELNW